MLEIDFPEVKECYPSSVPTATYDGKITSGKTPYKLIFNHGKCATFLSNMGLPAEQIEKVNFHFYHEPWRMPAGFAVGSRVGVNTGRIWNHCRLLAASARLPTGGIDISGFHTTASERLKGYVRFGEMAPDRRDDILEKLLLRTMEREAFGVSVHESKHVSDDSEVINVWADRFACAAAAGATFMATQPAIELLNPSSSSEVHLLQRGVLGVLAWYMVSPKERSARGFTETAMDRFHQTKFISILPND